MFSIEKGVYLTKNQTTNARTMTAIAALAASNKLSEKTNTDDISPCDGSAETVPSKISLLGIDFDNFSKQEFLSTLQRGIVFTPNVDHLMKLRHDPEFVSAYQSADYKVCDSQILMYTSKLLGKP